LGTVFFAEVNHGDLPHSQAAFLERAANITMVWADLDVDATGLGGINGNAAYLDAQYVMESHWLVGGGHTRFELDPLTETQATNVEVGRYLDDTSRMLATFAHSETETLFQPDSTTRTWGLEYKNLTRHPTASTALTLDMKYNYIDARAGTSNLFGLQGEYHFTLASSLLAGAEFTTGEQEGHKYNLGLMHFLTPYFAVGAEFTRKRPDDQQHTNTVAIRARMLF
jgi:hypothetical protein